MLPRLMNVRFEHNTINALNTVLLILNNRREHNAKRLGNTITAAKDIPVYDVVALEGASSSHSLEPK